MANSRATAVIVFSPPLISEMLRSSLPGGRATISMPLSSMSVSSSRITSAMPPPNSLRNSSWKCVRITVNVSRNSRRLSVLIRSMISCKRLLAPPSGRRTASATCPARISRSFNS